jgi:DNA-binding transcriptional LysR family regulator
VTGALARGEIDAGFGRFAAGATDAADAGLSHRLVRLEPVDAVMSARHSLAGAEELRPADLRRSVLWCPAQLSRLEFLRRFAAEFGIKTETGANLGLDHLLGELSADPRRFTLLPAELPLSRRDIRVIPLAEPTPLYAWSLAWREADQHPSMPALLRACADLGRANRWLEYNPERDWLPGAAPASG